ncbi:MAG: hypothetical protein ABI671_01445 [Burkholderiales bacterium]
MSTNTTTKTLATAASAKPTKVVLTTPVPPSAGTAASPRLPHENDEAVGSTAGVPSHRVQQGLRDIQKGVQDTSRATEADRTYRKVKKG